MRQRRTGDPTVTRKPGLNGTALRQEKRQKVAVLEQRAMAKAAQQEGLGIKAQKAAMTKPNGGVVGFHDANLEFHEADCPPPYRLLMPLVPAEAQPAIAEMWKGTLPDKEVRMALKRLAIDGKMRRVWKELQKLLRDRQEITEIIPSAIEALVMSALLRPPPQLKRHEALQRYQHYLDKLWINHPHPTMGFEYSTLAGWAGDLRNVLARLQNLLGQRSDEEWSFHWRRGPVYKDVLFQPFLDKANYAQDPAMSTMGAAISFLHNLFHCFVRIDDEQRSGVKRFPRLVRWDRLSELAQAYESDPRARQRFFAQIMSARIQELCDHPRRDVVAVLVCVAFKVDNVTTNTVREWCRKTGK
jgi:hypothetical protein